MYFQKINKGGLMQKKYLILTALFVIVLFVQACSQLAISPQQTSIYVSSSSASSAADPCDTLVEGTYCDGNALISCVGGDPVTNVDVTCVDICVDNNDGNAYCDMQQSQTPFVISLNQFCVGQSEGYYCTGALNDVLVYCSNNAAGVYWSCADAGACAVAEAAQDPSSC